MKYLLHIILFLFVFNNLVSAENNASIIEQRLDTLIELARTNPDSALSEVKFILGKIEENSNEEIQYKCLYTAGIISNRLNNYAQAVEYFQEAYQIAFLLNDIPLQVQSLNKLGSSRYDWSLYDLSSKDFSEALELAIANNLKKEESISLNYLGLIEYQNGRFDDAMNLLNQSLKIKEVINDSVGVASIYNTIGVINYSLQNFDEAIRYLEKSMLVKKAIGDLAGVSNNLLHLGNIYAGKSELDSTISLYRQSLSISTEINHPKLKAIAIGNIGEIYSMQGIYDSAFIYLMESQSIKEQIGDKKRIVYGLNAIGDMFINQKNFSEAEVYFQKSRKIALQSGLREPLMDCYLKLAEINSRTNNKKAAIDWYQKHIALNDSIRGLRSQELVNEFQAKYQSQKKQAQIDLLEQESEIIELKRQRSQYYNLILAATSFFLILLAFLIYSRYRLKNRTSKELSFKNQQLQDLTATKDKFYSILSHDIRSPLNAFHQLSESLVDNYTEMNSELQLSMLEEMKQSSSSLQELFENLLAWTKSQNSRIVLSNSSFLADELFHSVYSEIKEISLRKKVDVKLLKNTSNPIYSDKNILKTILRNLITNAIKFSEENTEVKVHIEEQTHIFNFTVKDEGIGISLEDQKKLFKIDKDISSIGSTIHKGSGLGLLIVKDFVEKLNGEIGFESKEGKGTSIFFSIPKQANNDGED